jgi:PAS domain S-box-containing protein
MIDHGPRCTTLEVAGRFAEHYRSLFEHVRDIVLMIDADNGTILDANHAAELAYGYSRDELIAMKVFDLRPDIEDYVGQQMRIADADGTLFEALHRRKDGSTFPVEVSSRGDTIDGQRVLFSIIRDISVRRELEQVREEFLVLASHELRTPVSNIGLRLQQLVRTAERGGGIERAITDAKLALEELRRLTHLVDTLLDAQVAHGEVVLDRALIDLGALVTCVIDRHRGHAERLGCTLVVETTKVTGNWDRVRLEQIVTNLFTNALKYGVGKPVRVAVTAGTTDARLIVQDEGIGLHRTDLDRIFEKFGRAAPPTNYGGLGLGLYIVRKLVEAHGGRIEVASTPGQGATFVVSLPRAT